MIPFGYLYRTLHWASRSVQLASCSEHEISKDFGWSQLHEGNALVLPGKLKSALGQPICPNLAFAPMNGIIFFAIKGQQIHGRIKSPAGFAYKVVYLAHP
jgi:hypothetical protein